jgi:hypothetical protein
MNNGGNELTIDDKIKELEKQLDVYDNQFCLNKVVLSPEVETILALKDEELRVLPRETCFSYAFLLAEFSLVVQKEQNRQTAKMKWAEHNLNIIVAKEQNNYGDKYTKYEIRKSMIIADNEYAKVLGDVIIKATCQIEELNFLATTINRMSDILKEYGKSKWNNNG